MPFGAVKVWEIFENWRLTTLCFWQFEPRKFNTVIKNIAEWMLRVV